MEILFLRQESFLRLGRHTANSRSLFPFNRDFPTCEQSLRCSVLQLFSHMKFDDTGCCGLLASACRWTESLKGFTFLPCVNNGKVIPAPRVSVSSDAAVVGTSEVGIESVALWRKVDRLVSFGNLDQNIGLITCERGLFSESPGRD